MCLMDFGDIYFQSQQWQKAALHYCEAIDVFEQLDHKSRITDLIGKLISFFLQVNATNDAACLVAIYQQFLTTYGSADGDTLEKVSTVKSQVQAQLTPTEFDHFFRQGQTFSYEAAIVNVKQRVQVAFPCLPSGNGVYFLQSVTVALSRCLRV